MTLTNRCPTGLAGLMISASILAASMDVSGVKLADPVEVAGSKIQLNGAGICYKAIFKVYVAALYLDKKAATPEEAYSAPGAKRISITLLRDIDSNELGRSFTKAFEENVPKNEISKLIPGLMRMGQVFADRKRWRPTRNSRVTGFQARAPSFQSMARRRASPSRKRSSTRPCCASGLARTRPTGN